MKEMQEQRELEALVAASGVQLVNVPKKQPSITEEGPPLSLDADSDDKQGKKDGTNKEVSEEDDGDVLGGAPPGVIKDRSPGRRGRFVPCDVRSFVRSFVRSLTVSLAFCVM